MSDYSGHPTIIVNVATNCSFTRSNYSQLNELYTKYKEQGLRIAAFPCNQFNGQEPGCETDIKEFLKKTNVEFDVYGKINVNGSNAIPLFNFLKTAQGGFLFNALKWNFTKFLVNKEGKPIARYAPNVGPMVG